MRSRRQRKADKDYAEGRITYAAYLDAYGVTYEPRPEVDEPIRLAEAVEDYRARAGMIGTMTDPYGKDFGRDAGDGDEEECYGEKSEETRQTWAILADLHAEVARLILTPWEHSTPHCIHEYNAGLANALAKIAEAVHQHGGMVDEPEVPPEEEPVEPAFTIHVAPPQIDTEAIAARVAEIMAPLIAAINRRPPNRPRGV